MYKALSNCCRACYDRCVKCQRLRSEKDAMSNRKGTLNVSLKQTKKPDIFHEYRGVK